MAFISVSFQQREKLGNFDFRLPQRFFVFSVKSIRSIAIIARAKIAEEYLIHLQSEINLRVEEEEEEVAAAKKKEKS